MKVTYKGGHPLRFISMDSGVKIIKPEETFEMTDELYNAEYKDNPLFEGSKGKKSKEINEGAE